MDVAITPKALGAVLVALLGFGFAAINAKGLPLAHTAQLLPSVYRLLRPRFRFRRSKTTSSSTSSAGQVTAARGLLFQPHVTTSRATLSDLDINLHKSNSTFFADADISRAALLTKLLSVSLADLGPANFILAGVQCRFGREIAPFQSYAISTRVLAWSEKSLFLVTYFLKPNVGLPAMPGWDLLGGGPSAVLVDDKYRKLVFATMVSRYVFRAGRNAISPEEVLKQAGLLLEGNNGETATAGQDPTFQADDLAKIIESGLEFACKGLGP
ncbi:capsule polysaccharide biosynthesis protein, partial [Metarhizium majus ARSEF 297]